MPGFKDHIRDLQGMSFTDQIKALHGEIHAPGRGEIERLPAYYVPRHNAWLRDQQPWSAEAQEHARKAFAGEYARERTGRISVSAVGNSCERELLFSFGGAPQLPAPDTSEDVMESGTFEHLRWQMEGITAGWLTEVEAWSFNQALRCGGSMDGVGDDDSLFELKNTAPHLYKSVAKGWDWLMEQRAQREKTGKGSAAAYAADQIQKHVTQMEGYKLLDSLMPTPRLSDIGSLVYQDRSSKDCYELRFRFSEERQAAIHATLAAAHDWIDLDELPDMLEGCAKASRGEEVPQRQLTVFTRCFYREWCPTATKVMA